MHAVLAVSVVLFVAGIWWGLPSYRGWAPDELFPSRVLDGMQHLFSHGWSDIYPPLHYYILGILYAPFYLLHKLRWINLEMLSWYTLLFYIARLVSVVMSTATVYLVYKCGREIFDDRSSHFAALISVFAVPYVYYAKLANLDSPYIFWFVLSLFYYLRILKTHRSKYYYLFTVAAVLAVCTKDQAYGLYVLSPMVILLSDWQSKREAGQKLSVFKAILERRYLFLILLGAGLCVLLHNIIFNARGFLAHFKLIVGPASKGYQIYPATLAGQAKLLGQTIAHIRFSFGWPLVLTCAAGLLLAASRPKKNRLLLSLLVFVVSYYVFYMAVILYNYDRFNMPINIVLSLFAGYALSTAWERARRFSLPRAAVVGLLFAYSLFYVASIDVLMIADGRYSVERWMKANIPKDAPIGVASPIEYCPRLDGYLWSNLPLSLPAFKQKSPRPEYVLFMTALSMRFADDTTEHRFFAAFTEGKIKFRRVLKYQTNLRWLPLRTEGAVTNLSTIDPEIQIYQNIARPGVPRE
jgi:4-amino-4-deoxy-L-arabinose transferase-like glycosyltransferase